MSSDPLQAGLGPWRPAAAVYFLFALTGLAAGYWPASIYHPLALQGGPLPSHQALAVAQVAFFLLAYPLILARRKPGDRFWFPCILESAALLAATAPLYAAAAFLADAVWTDCLRSALAVASFCPLSWAAGRCLGPGGTGGAGRWSSAVLIVLLLAAVGLPWAGYACRDFLGGARAAPAADALWHATPATFAWDAAASRLGGLWPRPVWVIPLWLAAAAGLAALSARRGSAP